MTQSSFIKIVLLLASLSWSPVRAQFSGDYAPHRWTFNSTTQSGDGWMDTTGAPASMVLYGSNNNNNGNCCNAYEEMVITMPWSGVISFSYNHDNPDVDRAYYVVNGTPTIITNYGSGGVNDISVNVGDVFGFRIVNRDNCCGRGVLTISNFQVSKPFTTWNGTGLWTDPTFWSHGIPSGEDSVIIGSGIVTVSTSITVADLTLLSPASLILSPGHILTIENNYNNKGGAYTCMPGATFVFEGRLMKNDLPRFITSGKLKIHSGALILHE